MSRVALSRVARRTPAAVADLLGSIGGARLQLYGLRGVSRARSAAEGLARACEGVARRHGLDLDAIGPRPSGPAILVANHVSWLDPVAIGALVPCVPIAKAEVESWPVVGKLCRELGVIFVKRGEPGSGARALLQARRALARGLPVLAFPEGTTTDGAQVLRLQRGLFGLARRLGVPVVPVSLRYEDPAAAWLGDDGFGPHWYATMARERTRVELRFGAKLYGEADEDPAIFAARGRAALRELLRASERWQRRHEPAIRAA